MIYQLFMTLIDLFNPNNVEIINREEIKLKYKERL